MFFFKIGYAVKDVSVYWIVKNYPEVFERLGLSWEDYVEVRILHAVLDKYFVEKLSKHFANQ